MNPDLRTSVIVAGLEDEILGGRRLLLDLAELELERIPSVRRSR